jgi:tryptophan-rich sensory protein
MHHRLSLLLLLALVVGGGLALGVIFLLLTVILGFIAASWRRDRMAAWLFSPNAAWVAFATLLNGSIFLLN